MDTSTYFIKNKAIFGNYPCPEKIKDLIEIGVTIFVDLTCEDEDLPNYTVPGFVKIKYPILDRYVPTNIKSFCQFIISISQIIKKISYNNKIYIHCKGGHGRSGLVVSCLICHMFSLSPFESLKYTNECHRKRKVMKEKWRKIGAPQTNCQKNFVYKIFKDINYLSIGEGVFSLNSNQYQFVFMDKEWSSVEKCLKFCLEKKSNIDDNKFDEILEDIIKERILQNENLQTCLINSNLRLVVTYETLQHSKKICDILTKIRIVIFTH